MAFIAPVLVAMGASAGTAATIGTVATVASTALAAVSAVRSAQQASANEKTAANRAEYDAKVADLRAGQVGIETNMREDEQRQRARIAIGQQLASSGEAGAGLNEDLLRQSVYNSEQDTTAIRYEGALKRAGYTDEVALQKGNAVQRRQNAREATTSGYIGAASALTQGAANYYGKKSLNGG